jgi:prepilin-type N-terminal cleavage/methylation domain-containing protein
MRRATHILRQRDGVTLVELIVAIVISAIVIAAAGSILISATNLIAHNTNRQTDITLAETILDFASEEMRLADGVEALESPNSGDLSATFIPGYTVIYVGNATGTPAEKGLFWFKGASWPSSTAAENIYTETFYQGRSISIGYEVTQGPTYDAEGICTAPAAVTLTVTVYNASGAESVTRSRSFSLLNLKNPSKPPLTADSGKTYPQTYPLVLKIETSPITSP